jgi:thioredoxin 1
VRSYLLTRKIVLLIVFVCSVYPMFGTSADAKEHGVQIPVPGMVTMVDLGAKKCVPCKMMAPILQELEKEYSERAAIVFIDVWVNPDAGRKFAIRTIPTQIFFDAEGKEVGRHEGFLDKASIVAELQKLGVE